MKVAITGSRYYENVRKIKLTLFELKRKFGNDLTILSGGDKYGTDKFVKKYALEFGLRYLEYNPAHTPKNLYSAMSDNYYDKPYHVSQFHHRNTLLAKACDVMMLFIPIGYDTKATNNMVSIIKKQKKPVTIIT